MNDRPTYAIVRGRTPGGYWIVKAVEDADLPALRDPTVPFLEMVEGPLETYDAAERLIETWHARRVAQETDR